MEVIKERSMKTFVLSSLINAGIGLAFGLIVGIFSAIMGGGAGNILALPVQCAIIFGIGVQNMYRIYFYYTLSLDINSVCKGDGMETESSLIQAILSSITFGLYGIYWKYKMAQRLKINAPRYGFKMLATGKEIAVLDTFSFGYISAWELLRNMNRIAKVYNKTGLADVVGGVQ